jgi:hypothetical protein
MLENEGAAPGYEEICAVIEERLIPVFELVGQRLQGLEESNAELKDTLFKIVSGFGDAVHEHKRGGFSEMLGSKFGPDMEELKGPYSDIYGKDLAGELTLASTQNFLGSRRAIFSCLQRVQESLHISQSSQLFVIHIDHHASHIDRSLPAFRLKPRWIHVPRSDSNPVGQC